MEDLSGFNESGDKICHNSNDKLKKFCVEGF